MEKNLTKSKFLSNSLIDAFFNSAFYDLEDSFFLGSYRAPFKETDTDYQYELCLPGIPKANINVSVEKNLLIVSYEIDKEKNYVVNSFKKSFSLPEDTDVSKITAKSEDGILTIKVPKSTPPDTKKLISID